MPQMQFHFCPSLVLVEVSAMPWKSLCNDVLSLSNVKSPTYPKVPLRDLKAHLTLLSPLITPWFF